MTLLVNGGLSRDALKALLARVHANLSDLRADVGEETLHKIARADSGVTSREASLFLTSMYKQGLSQLLPEYDIAPVPYDLSTDARDESTFRTLKPIGHLKSVSPPRLLCQPTSVAGLRVDFPVGLPASVLAANSDWIRFFKERGFCILTCKTVRSVAKQAHVWPNWVFLREADLSGGNANVGEAGYWPEDPQHVSMANSFGVPSLRPDEWVRDLAVSRAIVEEGHQILIASVVASFDETPAIVDDFVQTAVKVRDVGADVIELNYSCPNTQGEFSGEVYQHPPVAAEIARAVKEAVSSTGTPIFIKIGYLPEAPLRSLLTAVAPFIDGVVGINTMSVPVRGRDGQSVFPGRETAGISGWALRNPALEVAVNLVRFRDENHRQTGKRLDILSAGGILTKADYSHRMGIGVDAAEICTGAYLNPRIALDIRYLAEADHDIIGGRPASDIKTSLDGLSAVA